MAFKDRSVMDQWIEFLHLATAEGANIRNLCRPYRVPPTTAYRKLARYRTAGADGLVPRSRRPHTSPARTPPEVEARVLAVRAAHPTWGGRKIRAVLNRTDCTPLPAVSTITAILRRHGRLDGPGAGEPRAYIRFERETPNALWQLDFMGHRPIAGGHVHPLTIVDDHARFALGLFACPHEHADLIQQHLITVFRRAGLPEAILADNGPAWGNSHPAAITWLEAWWLRLGIMVLHGRPAHPQTQGKVERWHGTIATDLFQSQCFLTLTGTQHAFDACRHEDNPDRPHEALDLAVPGDRYRPSPRPYPDALPEIVYGDDHTVYRVAQNGSIRIAGEYRYISEGLRGQPVGICPTTTDGGVAVRFCNQEIKRLDLRHKT